MGMSQMVLQLKKALADVGISTGSTQDDVLMAATAYIATISKPEKGEWVSPPPVELDSTFGMAFLKKEGPTIDRVTGEEVRVTYPIEGAIRTPEMAAALEQSMEKVSKPKAKPKAPKKKVAK